MPTHHIRTSSVWVECVKLYGIVTLSLSMQLTGTSRSLLQLCLPDKYLAMSFLPDGHVSLYLHLPSVWVNTGLSYATGFPPFTVPS